MVLTVVDFFYERESGVCIRNEVGKRRISGCGRQERLVFFINNEDPGDDSAAYSLTARSQGHSNRSLHYSLSPYIPMLSLVVGDPSLFPVSVIWRWGRSAIHPGSCVFIERVSYQLQIRRNPCTDDIKRSSLSHINPLALFLYRLLAGGVAVWGIRRL